MHRNAAVRHRTVWLAIVGYTLVASGLPLPVAGVARPERASPAAKRLAGKDRSLPFPCMDKPCGCATAERCFTSCCCHAPAETLAWAKAHRVEPAVLRALERRVACATPTVAKVPKASCCASDAAGDAPAAEPSCCASTSSATGPASAEDAVVEQPRTRSVTLRAMLACGGIVAEWFAAGAALPPPRAEVSLAMRVLGRCVPADDAGECPRARPTAPPPRAA